MPTVIERVNVSVDADALDARLGVQVDRIRQIAALIERLATDPPDDVGEFLSLAANLPVPALEVEGDFATGIAGALDRLPAELPDVTGAVDADLARFATLVTEGLAPLLEDAVRVASAVEKLVAVDLRCDTGPSAGAAEPPGDGDGGGDGEPDGEEDNVGAARLTRTSEQVQQVNDLIDRLPPSLTPGGAIEFLFGLADQKSRSKFLQLYIPAFDDVVEPLRTLSRWQALTPVEVAAELEATLSALDARLRSITTGRIDELGSDLDDLVPQLALPALTSFGDDYAAGLDDLVAALEADDLPAAGAPVAQLDAALDAVAPTLAAWEGGVADDAEDAIARLETLAGRLVDDMSHLLLLLEPVELPSRAAAIAPAPQAPSPDAVAAAQAAVQPVIDWLEALVAVLDFSSVQDEVGTLASEAQELADGVEQGLTGVAVEVRALFDDVSTGLGSLDLGSLQGELESQLEGFATRLESSLGDGFAPAATAIGDAVQALSDALDAFDPADVVAALTDVLDAIAGVLEGPEVQGAVEEVRDAVETVTQALDRLSFTPVTDEVVALIEQMTDALNRLGESDLNAAAKAALSAALEVLPDSLEPVTDPILAEFDGLIESEAVPLVERVADKPAALLAEITRFQPGALVGDALSAPYREALERAEDFTPGTLIAGADSALDEAKQRLIEDAAPSRALSGLREPFERLRGELERYSPDAVLAPLEAAVEQAIADVVDASPVDEIFDVVNRIFAVIDAGLGIPRELVATLERLNGILEGFANPQEQLDAWRDGVLDKVGGLADTSAIATTLASLATTIAESGHDALGTRLETALAGASAPVAAFAPGARVTRLVAAHARARSLAGALADSPQKSDILAVLDRFEPATDRALRLTQRLDQALSLAIGDVDALADEWHALVEDPDGALAETTSLGADATALRTLLASAMEPVLAPARYLFSLLEAIRPAVSGMIETLQGLVDTLTEGVAALLTGPASLQSISDAIQQVVDRLRNVDLGFLREGLQRLFTSLLDQLDALDPARLGEALDAAFAELLEGIRIESVIPPGEVAALDGDYGLALEKLRALDPETLVTEVVQPQYDATVAPLVAAFDLTPAFEALVEFLRNIGEELDAELGRVNTAYQGLRAARPSLGGSVDVGVSF